MRGTMPERRYAVNPPPLRRAGDFSVPQGLVLLRQLPRLGLPRGFGGVPPLDGEKRLFFSKTTHSRPRRKTAPDGKKVVFFKNNTLPPILPIQEAAPDGEKGGGVPDRRPHGRDFPLKIG